MKFLLRTLIVSTLLLASAVPAAIVTVDRIVAVINRGVITRQDLDERIESIRKNLLQQGTTPPAAEVLETETLQRMITEQVLLEQASRSGINVDDTQLEQALTRIAQRNQLSLPEFRQRLEADGINWRRFSNEIRQEMTLSFLREREIDNRIVVTDSEIDEHLKFNADKAQLEYRIAQIMVSVPENATPEQLQQKRIRILAARQELEEGKPFSAVAATYSNSADAANGGVIGWRASGALAPAFVELLEQLKPEGITDIVRSGAGLHIFKLLEKRTQANTVIVRQTHARHLLTKIDDLTPEYDARIKMVQIRERLVNGEKFDELARLFSEDNTASKGGDLGWLSPGDTVPEFEQAMDKLNPGDLSELVRSPFGYHLIKVIERRDQDVTATAQRSKARQDLRSRKSDERFEDWVRQLRDKAYISIRLKDE